MPETVDPVKVATVTQLGGRIEFVKDLVAVFEKLDALSTEEGLSVVHPYDAKGMILGASTCGLELITQVPDLDAAVVPVGGGALMFATLKVAVEPACPAALAGVCGPLRERLEGRTVGVIACGSNISPEKALASTTKGSALLSAP